MTTFKTVAPLAPTAAPATAVGSPQLGRWMQTLHSDAWVPLTQAAIGGGLIASTLVIVGGIIVATQQIGILDAAPPLTAVWLLSGIGITTALYFRQLQAVQATWWNAELLTGQDLDGDGQIGRPDVGTVKTSHWSDQDKRDAEALRQMRFEEFIAKLYRAGKTDTGTIRELGFSEDERKAFIDVLRNANAIRATRKGEAAGWVFLPQTAAECVDLTRKRVIFMSRASSSSSSSAEK